MSKRQRDIRCLLSVDTQVSRSEDEQTIREPVRVA